ncbi:hypothetical protein OHA25_17365 [Nonomuraea sp. NBC_00507]|uniref:TolB family protein n=1 Tax=Nonomuraea sp. NBC_00507 TaxID=2976002 RepID=UPI002E19234F
MNPDGTGRVNLTNDTMTQNQHPAWSPDGAKILWDTNRGGGTFQIWVMNANGTGQRQLTNDPNSNSRDPDQQRLITPSLTISELPAEGFTQGRHRHRQRQVQQDRQHQAQQDRQHQAQRDRQHDRQHQGQSQSQKMSLA